MHHPFNHFRIEKTVDDYFGAMFSKHDLTKTKTKHLGFLLGGKSKLFFFLGGCHFQSCTEYRFFFFYFIVGMNNIALWIQQEKNQETSSLFNVQIKRCV